MKKLLLLIALITITSHYCYSQVSLGAKAGANVSDISYDEIDLEYSPRVGYHLGLYAELQLGEKLFVRPELLYSVKGGKYEETPTESEAMLSYGYINLPLLIGFRPIANLSVYAGPEVGFLATAKSRTEDKNYDLKELEVYEEFDLGAAIGLAYSIGSNIALDIRYVHGLNTLIEYHSQDGPGMTAYTTKDGNNRTLQIGVSYKLFGR